MVSAYRHVEGWPQDSIALTRGKKRITQILINVSLFLLILLFLIYAELIRHSNNKPDDSDLVRQLDRVSHYGPTIFPIVFTLVIGGSLRSLALYRLQAGETIGLLDLLLGSTTLGSAIETLFERRFHYFDITSLGLLLLWALSPLGGQATLRVIRYDYVHSVRQVELAYLDYVQSAFPSVLTISNSATLFIPSTSAFISSLTSPASFQTSPSDIWGNVKIPFLELLPGYESAGPGDWVTVPGDTTAIWYSSLVGVPIGNIPPFGRTQFRMEAAYWDISCPSFRIGTVQDALYTGSLINFTTDPIQMIENSELQGATSYSGWILSNDTAETTSQRCHLNKKSHLLRRQLMYRSFNNADESETVANCSIGTSYVEVSIDCHGWYCGVDRVRRSLRHPRVHSTAVTGLDMCDRIPHIYPSAAKFFFSLMQAVDSGLTISATPGLLQYYLQHPNRTQGYYEDIQLNSLGNKTFAHRFSVLLNTYWSAIYNMNLTSSGHTQTLQFDDSYYYYQNPTSNTTGKTTLSERRFVFNRAWYAVLVLSTSILFLTAFCKLVLDLHILIPHLQMNASTLLRGNMANCPSFPYGGSALDDDDRSRLLRHHRVRFGQRLERARQSEELGIGELEEDEGSVKKVVKGKKYY
ncbi:hypothetical protein F5Y07DRAFT_411421 [Xylaria sp. FL0933]|nr:hypothetical protein F5Y07DRAFT_411421 [Xylaria sp. FL0933]